jgi:hypothetical protein
MTQPSSLHPSRPTGNAGVIQRHLLMALHCNEQAEQLHRAGQAEAAQRQRMLLAVFLQNALGHLPGQAAQASPAPPPV